MGLVVSTFGDNLKAELATCLPVLVDRMGNEITRLTAVKVGLLLSSYMKCVWPYSSMFIFQSPVFLILSLICYFTIHSPYRRLGWQDQEKCDRSTSGNRILADYNF